MRIGYLAIAAVLAFSTPVLAASPNLVEKGNFNGDWMSAWSTSGQVKTGSLVDGKAAKVGVGGVLGIISQSFTVSSTGTLSLAFDYAATKALTVLLTSPTLPGVADFSWGTTIAKNTLGSFAQNFNVTAGTYTLSFLSTNALVDTVSAKFTATPVPGPEAGAGLGALAMGGIALYLKRRRKEEVLAA